MEAIVYMVKSPQRWQMLRRYVTSRAYRWAFRREVAAWNRAAKYARLRRTSLIKGG